MQAIVVKRTLSKGWGVFANRDFAAGELVDVSPVVVMSTAEMKLLNQTKLHDYIFHWEHEQCCMALGSVPIYNHAAPSNCEYFQDYEQEIIEVKTVVAIKAGEELTINYNGDAQSKKGVWFKLTT